MQRAIERAINLLMVDLLLVVSSALNLIQLGSYYPKSGKTVTKIVLNRQKMLVQTSTYQYIYPNH